MPFRREVETARAWGVPRSVFLGRVVAAGEPLWLPEDRWWALALADVEADTCRDCGHPLTETTSPQAAEAYAADVVRCHACAAAAQRVAAFTSENGQLQGLQVSVTRKT